METRAMTDNTRRAHRLIAALSVLVLAAAIFLVERASAQETAQAPLTAAELEELVGPVALYPDELLAIVLPASTYPLQVVQAARFLEDRANDTTLQANPDWDDSIVALLNYPEIVRMMNEDLDWTWDLGAAVLADQAAVIDAVQAFRDRAYAAGNLKTDDRQVVTKEAEVIEIAPADPEVVYIPYYEPERVVVYHSTPAYYYYPYAYPVYYYPYPVGYGFTFGFFWGVTSAYSIGWYSHCVQVYHHTHVGHPYYHNPYYDYAPYYGRSGVVVNVNAGYASNVWYHDYNHGGPHPQHRALRVAYEGYGQPRGGGTYDGGNHDNGNHGGGNHGGGNHDNGNHGGGNHDGGNHDNGNHGGGNHDGGNHDNGNHDGGNAYGFARSPSRTAGRSEAGSVTQSGIARQLGAAREGRSAQPFAVAPSAQEGARSGATRSPGSSGSTPPAEVRSQSRMLGRVATESPWRSREDFRAPASRGPARTNESYTVAPPSMAPPASDTPRSSGESHSSFTPRSSGPARSAPAPQSGFSGGGREAAPQRSAPSSGRMSGGGHAGGGRAGGGRSAQRSD